IIVLTQHYEKRDGDEGAKIVADLEPPRVPKDQLKTDARLLEAVGRVLRLGFDPARPHPISPADFTHPDALLSTEKPS
ncbi:hypothetical protein HZA57_05515, partial [Candidatus Poribacteria bacterium]|nr:hypothetical protein [Candidatus Poribacteria bacterium]